MKKTLLLLTIILSGCGSVTQVSNSDYQAITNNNFLIDNSVVVWQKVIETDLSFDDFVNKMKEMGVLYNIETMDGKLIGDINLVEADYKGAGYGYMTTPIYISRNFIGAHALIEFREGRYRVVLRNIMLTQQIDDPLSKMGELTPIEFYALTNGEFNRAFIQSSEILDFTFSNIFTIKESKLSDDW